MGHCISTAPLPLSIVQVQKPGLTASERCRTMSTHGSNTRNGLIKLIPTRANRNSREYYSELGFKEKGDGNLEFDSRIGRGKESDTTDLDVLELKDRVEEEDSVRARERNEIGDSTERNENLRLMRGKQMTRRSNMLAKQVISIQSALSLGFVSQIWVETTSWMVLVVEVKPNLLSGDSEKFLLEDVKRVGDVVLVEDENVLENEVKMVGLETLVGYDVMTPGQRYIGKVRGYSFNVNSGAVEMLELDSFGISIIPSSLVSTYALPVEDVLEVLSDTIVVHETAASRIQRLTKGFWGARNVRTCIDEIEEYSDGEYSVRSEHGRSTKRRSHNRKLDPRIQGFGDDWELPMDFL